MHTKSSTLVSSSVWVALLSLDFLSSSGIPEKAIKILTENDNKTIFTAIKRLDLQIAEITLFYRLFI